MSTTLHPWTWVAIGVIVIATGISLGPPLDFIVWLGIFALGYGIWHLIRHFLFRHDETRFEHHITHHGRHGPPRHSVIHYLRCHNCKSVVRSIDYYCWKCGRKLR